MSPNSAAELPYAETIVGQYFPLDGPYDPEHTKRAGSVLSELVRYLNYATRYREALPHAADIGDLVGTLQASVAGLRQTFEQVDDRCAKLAGDPNLYDHTEGDHATAIRRAEEAANLLATAARRVTALDEPLRYAHIQLGFLGHRDGGQGE